MLVCLMRMLHYFINAPAAPFFRLGPSIFFVTRLTHIASPFLKLCSTLVFNMLMYCLLCHISRVQARVIAACQFIIRQNSMQKMLQGFSMSSSPPIG